MSVRQMIEYTVIAINSENVEETYEIKTFSTKSEAFAYKKMIAHSMWSKGGWLVAIQ